MVNNYSFTADFPIEKHFDYVYSPRCRSFGTFAREEENLVNFHNDSINDYEYISILTRESFPAQKLSISTECSFDHFGAPLIVFTDDTDESGEHIRYGVHFEVVAYEGGINIWYIRPAPGEKDPVAVKKIAFAQFPVPAKEMHTLTVRVEGSTITAELCGKSVSVDFPDLPACLRVGITACEGINRFRSLTVEA